MIIEVAYVATSSKYPRFYTFQQVREKERAKRSAKMLAYL